MVKSEASAMNLTLVTHAHPNKAKRFKKDAKNQLETQDVSERKNHRDRASSQVQFGNRN